MRHRLYGLRVDSEIPLGAGADDDPGPPDVRIRWDQARPVGHDPPAGAVIARRTVDGTDLYTVTSTGHGTTIRFHGSCDVAISADLGDIRVAPDPAFARDMVPVLIVGTVAAVLLSLRGLPVLHGAAVQGDGGVVAFIGPSGVGKSTVAALCCAAGARLVSDDLVPIDSSVPPRVAGGWPELRLRPSAAGIADLFPERPPTRLTADGRLAVACPPSDAPYPILAAVVVPRPTRDRAEVSVQRLGRVEAMFSMVTADRIDGWSTPAGQQAQFESAARLAAGVPAFLADVPWGPPFHLQVGGDLLARVLRPPPG